MTHIVSEKTGKYMGMPARERVYSIGSDYKGTLFPEGTESAQVIDFRRGRNRVKKPVKPAEDTASLLLEYNSKPMQKDRLAAIEKREKNKYIKQIIRGTGTRELKNDMFSRTEEDYITIALVRNRYEKIDVRYELGLYPAPYLALLKTIRSLRTRLYG